ncbi:MAG: DUF5666 domain-containing protein, partial [Porticoccus sp.]|nr:DUF5666 domain-containing protein [Porticoccus sp.]
LFAVTGISLVGCGGGGSSSSSSSTPNTTVGAITSFGSVFVNGCEYDTDSASFTIDGQPGTEADLSVGDVVEVFGPSNCVTGTALSINFADELEGVVDSNAVAAGVGTMVVMGQNITVNDLTIFDDETGGIATVDAIAAGNVVEISGFGVGTGDIVASRIEVKAATHTPGNEIEVKGVVSSLDTTAMTFTIGGLTINYGSATLDDISVMEDGLYVEAKATDYTAGSFTLAATKVEREDDGEIGHQGDHEDEFEIKGMLTAAYDDTSKTFGINDQMILVNDNTDLEDITLADLVAGNIGTLNLEAEGMFNADGMLVAEEVNLEDDISDNDEYQGTITNLSAPAGMNSGTLMMTVGAGSMDVTINNDTMMKDSHESGGMMPEDKFNFTHLQVGDLIEVHVDPTSGIAVKLERE